MTDRFSTAVTRGLSRHPGRRTVTYARGEDSVQLTVIVGQTESTELSPQLEAIVSHLRDYLLTDASSLVLGGVLTRPQPGDRITDGALVFEVLPAGDDEPCYRFSGPDRQMLRIHTKEA